MNHFLNLGQIPRIGAYHYRCDSTLIAEIQKVRESFRGNHLDCSALIRRLFVDIDRYGGLLVPQRLRSLLYLGGRLSQMISLMLCLACSLLKRLQGKVVLRWLLE